MTIRSDISIDWSASPRIIEVAAPSTELIVQDLYDTLRDKAASSEAMDEPEIIDGSGKEDLGGGISVGLTVNLLNAKVKFEDRPGPDYIQCTIGGGNLVGGPGGNPIKESAYTQVKLILSASGTIAAGGGETVWTEGEKDDLIADAVLIKSKTTNLPADPTSKSDLEAAHGAGSWEGATSSQLWGHADRRLTSRDIDSELPGEHLPSEEQVQDLEAVLNAIKGLGFESTEDALRVIRQLVESGAPPRATFKI